MSSRVRSYLFVMIGLGLGIYAYHLDPCAFGNGPCPSNARPVGFISFVFIIFLGIGPLLNRFIWKATKMSANEYQMMKWKSKCEGPMGGLLMWWSGIREDGSTKE